MQPNADALKVQVERIREIGFLGQARLLQLFDYLVQCTSSGRVPKEAEVAVEVFGRSSTADLSQDASVRVYVHNLRRKLDQYYGGPGRNEAEMLVLPKGEYRLQLRPNPLRDARPAVPATVPAASAGPRPPLRRRYLVTGCIALGFAAGLLAMAAVVWMPRRGPDALAATRASAFWAPVLAGGRPILLVVGDYYIFGDTGGDMSMNVTRLIRDFTINSRSDLQQYLVARPQEASRYQDVGLSYLPTSSAYALANLMPVLQQVKSRVRVTLASQLNPSMIKNSDLIYIGLLSGMAALEGPAFSASRFQFGDSFDELIDRRSGRHYVSQAVDYADDLLTQTDDSMYRDYGYLSSFTGPTGNRIVVIAGMQDEGLRQAVDFLTDRASLDQLARQVRGRADLEGLLEVSAMNHLNLSGKLLLASPLAPAAWRFDGTGTPAFMAGARPQ